jgi:hypothetical protein
MTDMNQNMGMPDDKPSLPSGLNILTILTFIGSGIGFLSSIYSCINAKSTVDKMEETINSAAYETMPAFAKKFLSPEALEVARKSYENRIPILAISLIGIVLCVYGAIQMRKRKMQGYYTYLIGEIIPLLVMPIFLGMTALTGIPGIIAICITLLFVLLYTGQRKHLTN